MLHRGTIIIECANFIVMVHLQELAVVRKPILLINHFCPKIYIIYIWNKLSIL